MLTEPIVYDFLPSWELNIEKSRLIYENTLKAQLQIHGYPDQDPQCHDNYIRVHAKIFVTTLGIARQTQIRVNDKSQLAEDSSKTEATNVTTYPQITMPSSDPSNELGSVMPSDTIITRLQQPAMQQLPSLGHTQNIFPVNQANMVQGAASSSTDITNIFGQQIYHQQHPVGPLPQTPYPYDQNQRYDDGVGYYLLDHPYPSENSENWDMQPHQEHR